MELLKGTIEKVVKVIGNNNDYNLCWRLETGRLHIDTMYSEKEFKRKLVDVFPDWRDDPQMLVGATATVLVESRINMKGRREYRFVGPYKNLKGGNMKLGEALENTVKSIIKEEVSLHPNELKAMMREVMKEAMMEKLGFVSGDVENAGKRWTNEDDMALRDNFHQFCVFQGVNFERTAGAIRSRIYSILKNPTQEI